MHAQPPLHNFFYAFLIKLFYPDQDTAFKIFQSAAGALMTAVMFYIINDSIKNKLIKIIAILAVVLNPAVFLFESYPMYSLNSAFLIVLTFLAFYLFEKKGRNSVVLITLFFITLNFLLLYRSVFHIFFLFVCCIFVYFAADRKILLKIIIISILTALPVFAWNMKNYYLYGFFGSSSWLGLNLNKCITSVMPRYEKKYIYSSLKLNPAVMEMQHFYNPVSSYAKYGFNKHSNIPFLNDDNWHNINVPDISSLYFIETKKIIFHLPKRYFKTCIRSFELFSHPPYTYAHLNNNKILMGVYPIIYNNFFFPDNFLLKKIFNTDIYPVLFLMPLISFGFYVFYFIKSQKKIPKPENFYSLIYLSLLLLYYFIVSNMLEYGENNRFKFTIEPLIYLYFFMLLDKFYTNNTIDKCNNKKIKNQKN